MILRLIILVQIFAFGRVNAICQPCNIDANEVYYLKQDLLNLREKPNVNSKVIKVLRIKTASLEILNEDSIFKDYILVKAKIDSFNVKTGEEIHLGEYTGWVNFNLVDFSSDSYSFITGGEDENLRIDELLNKQEALKSVGSCKYNPSELSYCYCKKGIYSFENNEFLEAIEFFNKSINVSTINSIEYRLMAYFYRGKSKLNLNDYYGAKSDFERVYSCKSRYNNRLVYDWSSKYSKNSFIRVGYNYPSIVKEEVYLNMAICKMRLKNYSEALIDLNSIIERNSKFGYSFYLRAYVYKALNKKKLACLDASKAGELGIKEAYDFISEFCQ